MDNRLLSLFNRNKGYLTKKQMPDKSTYNHLLKLVETSNIPQHIIKKLSYRFKHIIILYDTDKTGLESSLKHVQQLSDLGVKRLVLPLAGTKQEKDISDYFRMGNTRNNFMCLASSRPFRQL